MRLSASLAQFATNRSSFAVAEDVYAVMRLSLFDWIAVGRAGVDQPVSKLVRQMVLEDGGAGIASVFGCSDRLPAKAAALSNGTTSHALDYDDTHFANVGHPSVAIIPAALAVAEKVGATGKEFLDAALIGVEAATRVGIWLGRAHYQLGFHQTATAGCFGATLAACRLLGATAQQTQFALGIASTRASGLKSQFGTMGKPYNAGIAAANGVEAAELSVLGFVSVLDGIECAQGFGETHGAERPDPDAVLSDLGTTFLFESVQHKFHACCHGLHAGLEALIEAREQLQISSHDVRSVMLTVNPRWSKVCNIPVPSSGLEAKFSYRLTAAMILAGWDTSALSTFSEVACQDGVLIDLRDRVTVREDSTVSDTETQVVIELLSGRSIRVTHDLSHPLALNMREAKVKAKGAGLLGSKPAAILWDRVCEAVSSSEEVRSFNLIGSGQPD
ncbi:MAG: MmgE/PrpD family protein [Stappiaceae bacterium]